MGRGRGNEFESDQRLEESSGETKRPNSKLLPIACPRWSLLTVDPMKIAEIKGVETIEEGKMIYIRVN